MDENPRVPFNPYPNWPVDIREEVFARLIHSEKDFMLPKSYCDNEESKVLRRYAVGYIEEIYLGNMDEKFDALIPYMAMTYFDRFCSGGDIPLVAGDVHEENTTLCLLCCLTIAWKLRTKQSNIPQFLVDQHIQFTIENVLNMELQIVKRLNWQLRAPTPLSFVEYFLEMVDLPPDLPSPLRCLRQLIIRSQHDVAFAKYGPSFVAATAAFVVTKSTSAAIFVVTRAGSSDNQFNLEIGSPHLKMMRECEEKLQLLYIDLTKPAAAGSTLSEFESDSDLDEVMKFELGWAEALKKLDARSSNLAQRLAECCNGFRQGCHIQ